MFQISAGCTSGGQQLIHLEGAGTAVVGPLLCAVLGVIVSEQYFGATSEPQRVHLEGVGAVVVGALCCAVLRVVLLAGVLVPAEHGLIR